MKKLLVTGTDTDVGKTWVSQLILKQLAEGQHKIGAYKPACSGGLPQADGTMAWSDVDLLFSAITRGTKELVCPQVFEAAVAPNVAAEMEGSEVNDELLTSGCFAWQALADLLLIEGAGGLCCPLSNSTSVADLAQQLNAPIVIVAANRLGVINHTLLTVEVARSRGLKISAVILNDCQHKVENDLSPASNFGQLKRLLPDLEIHTCQFGARQIESMSTAAVSRWFS